MPAIRKRVQTLQETRLKTKLSDLALVAEIISAAAIVISLVYVGVQINENSREVRSAMANETTAAVSAWYTSLGNNQQASRLFHVGLSRPEELADDDIAQFFYLAHGLMLEFQAAYYVSLEGTLDLALQDSITKTLSGSVQLPGFQMYWQQRRNLFYPEFRARVEAIIAAGPNSDNLDFQKLYELPDSQ